MDIAKHRQPHFGNKCFYNFLIPLQAQKTTRTRIKPRTKQENQILRNANLSLIQDQKRKMQGKNILYARR
jgi:hypothetical protein